MDPSIMKLLDEDEDESLHSGAAVDAFTAALNRDIEGDTSTSLPSDNAAALSQGSNHPNQFQQWQTSIHDENASFQSQHDVKGSVQQEQHSSIMEQKLHVSRYEHHQQQMDTSQELKCLPLPQKQPLDEFPQQQAEQKSIHASQTMSLQNSQKQGDKEQKLDSESQYPRIQKMSNQQAIATGQAINAMNRSKQVPFGLLLPVIEPQLDKDRAMQLQTLYNRLKKNEITKEEFVRHMRSLVGDQMLKMAVYKLQGQAARNPQSGPQHFQLQSHASAQKQIQVPSAGHVLTNSSNPTMATNTQSSREVEGQSDAHGTQVNQISPSSSAVNQERDRPFPLQGLTKQQQQHLHFAPASFPSYGSTGGNYHPYPGTNISNSAQSLKQQPHDSQMRQVPVHPSMGATQLGMATQAMNAMSLPKFERPNSYGEPKRGGTLSHLTNNSTVQQNSVRWQSLTNKDQKNGSPSSMTYVKQEPVDQSNEQQQKSQLSTSQGISSFPPAQVEQGNAIPGSLKDESLEMQSSRMGFPTSLSAVSSTSATASVTSQLDSTTSLSSRIPSAASPIGGSVTNAKAPQKKPSIGQKKPLEALGSSPPLPSKKQKVSGAFSDQSIEQLNDVTAVSGVNLREEEEQLFSGPKEDSRVSEASRRVVQEEEERLILQKVPLQKKLAEIMAKSGLKNISNDVERCLSLCVEERIRGLLSNLIRLSKQRVDIEKPGHRTVITSDVGQQIAIMNRKAREEWDKKQADTDKLQKTNEPEGSNGVDADKEKDDGRGKSVKVNKEDDDKMRTTAANVAARAAVGGDDMLSKWQLMAEQARQKREGGTDAASGSQPGRDMSRKSASNSSKNASDDQESEKRSYLAAVTTSGSVRKFGSNQAVTPQNGVARVISVKDVIAVLEREPQTSKSPLIYRLYEKMRGDVAAE